MRKVGIIGSGYTGLSCAKKLVEKGYDVTIFECTNEIGGIAKCIDCNGTRLEKHYRHIFKSDKFAIDLLKELNLGNKLQWNETKMAYFSKEGLYAFGTPYTLLKYKPLSFFEKIIFGLSVIRIKLIKNYKKIEKYTAEEWVKKNCGKKVYEKIWEPLLITKFGTKKDKISMAWLWGKINLRSSSGTLEGERLGYLDGSYDLLTKELEKYLIDNNCKISLNECVEKVSKNGNKYKIKTDKRMIEDFDYIVNTVAYDVSKKIFSKVLSSEEKNKMENLKYTSAKTLVIHSKKSFTPYYWINIGDRSIPFGGVIEHTNMMDKSNYGNEYIIYISNYMYSNDRLYKLRAKELFKEYYPHLKKINSNIKEEDITKLECYEEDFAQPIITTDYSKNIVSQELKCKNIFMGTMAQIYPEDRGMNYAIKVGYEIAEKIINKN